MTRPARSSTRRRLEIAGRRDTRKGRASFANGGIALRQPSEDLAPGRTGQSPKGTVELP